MSENKRVIVDTSNPIITEQLPAMADMLSETAENSIPARLEGKLDCTDVEQASNDRGIVRPYKRVADAVYLGTKEAIPYANVGSRLYVDGPIDCKGDVTGNIVTAATEVKTHGGVYFRLSSAAKEDRITMTASKDLRWGTDKMILTDIMTDTDGSNRKWKLTIHNGQLVLTDVTPPPKEE